MGEREVHFSDFVQIFITVFLVLYAFHLVSESGFEIVPIIVTAASTISFLLSVYVCFSYWKDKSRSKSGGINKS